MTGPGDISGGSARPVMVAMLTYCRPDNLAEAIPAVLEQATALHPAALLLVVDNDPAGSAAAEVARWADRGVRYVHEAEPGIVAARNRALTESSGFDLLVFIDDDEHPEPGWLQALLDARDRYGGAAVVGAVVSAYDAEPEPWIIAGRFFDRRRLPTGTVTDVAATNNLLLDLAVVRAGGLRFDARFAHSGGSDTLFTRQLAQHGPLIWCDEAVVVDRVPVTRLTRSWVLRRAFRSGNSWVRTSVLLAPTATARVSVRCRETARGTVRLAGGAARWAVGAVTGSVGQRARGRRTIARGAGFIAGAVGHVHEEYRREGVSDQVPPAAVAPAPAESAGADGAHRQLGVIVVNYGTHGLLAEGLAGAQNAAARIVVVDNAHSPAERAAVTALCRERGWDLVPMATNAGFGAAANAGASEAIRRGCDTMLILNPDARIDAKGCRRLADLAREHPRSLISPQILRPDGSVWFRGSAVDPRSGRVAAVTGAFISGPESWLTGACLAIAASFWAELGGFAGGYFLYWEDVDLSTRCVRAGGTLILAPDVTAVHEVGGTQTSADGRGRAKSRVYYRYNTRNRLLYAARLLPIGQLWSWVVRTPAESAAILLRGGRRQLVTSPGVLWSAVAGSTAGLGLALAELGRRAAGRSNAGHTRRDETARNAVADPGVLAPTTVGPIIVGVVGESAS